jgi:hypothetical protein
MADIFPSYAREDATRACVLATALQAALILAAPCAGMVGAMFGFVLQPSRDSTNPDAK